MADYIVTANGDELTDAPQDGESAEQMINNGNGLTYK